MTVIHVGRCVSTQHWGSGSGSGGSALIVKADEIASDQDDYAEDEPGVTEVVTFRFQKWVGPQAQGGIVELSISIYDEDIDAIAHAMLNRKKATA